MFLCFLKPDRPSAPQWQLDKWLKKSRKKCASTEQNSSQTIPGRPHSPHTHQAPSPARSFDSNQEYSPSQSPIPSPQFNYSNNNSPLPSPGYSYCPSPSPFTSTCQSPSPSPRHSPIPSPVISICPSPCGSPRDSRSPSPIARHPPRSPSPSIPPPSRVCHYPEFQSQNQPQPIQSTNSHRTKIRPWIAPVSNTNIKSKSTTNTRVQPSDKHRPKARPPQEQGHTQSKSRASTVLTSSQNQSHKSRPKTNFYPNHKQLADASQTRITSNFEQLQGSRSSHKPRPPFEANSQHSPTRAKHLIPTSRETNPVHSSHSQSPSKAPGNSGSGSNPRSIPTLKHRTKSWEAPTTVHVNHSKTTQKKPQTKEQEVAHRRDHLTTAEGRKHERKEDRLKDKQQGKREQKEDRRLAEEQLRRRSWIQSSAEEEEEEEEEGVTEQERRREETTREESRRKKEEQQRNKWQAKQKVPTNNSHHQGRTKKQGRSEEDRELQPDPSPPLSSRSPTPQRTSSSSSSSTSSSSDSESEFQAPITKVPADSTSQRKLIKKGEQGPGRPDASRPKVIHHRRPSSGNPSEAQQSEGKQKLYTLVPFGRGNKTAPPSQRGLRNLVVHIDLCLLKRVPDSAANSTPKKPSSSSSSSSAKDKQSEDMKHLCVSEASTKDSTRKRKVDTACVFTFVLR